MKTSISFALTSLIALSACGQGPKSFYLQKCYAKLGPEWDFFILQEAKKCIWNILNTPCPSSILFVNILGSLPTSGIVQRQVQ